MLKTPLTFYKPNMRFEGKKGAFSKASCIAIFNKTAIRNTGFNAMAQILMKIQIQKTGGLDLRITKAIQRFKCRARSCEIEKRPMKSLLKPFPH